MKDIVAPLQALLEQGVAAGEVAGVNLLVLRNGREIAYAQAGFADLEGKKPYIRDTISRLYSMSKPVTAAAAMLLVQRGQLDLAQPLGEVLPAFRNMQVWEQGRKVPARRDILIADLLRMTSGLSYPGEEPSGAEVTKVFEELDRRLYTDQPMSTMELMEGLGQCALAFHPGDRWMYGTSADVLGAVVQAVSGQSFGAFLQENLFGPLGMEDTGFYVPEEKRPRLAQVYERKEKGMERYETNHLGICYTQHRSPAFESGGAGLVSTVDDYAKFAAMLMGGGGGILAPAAVDFMTRSALLPWQRETLWRTWEGLGGHGYGGLMRVLEEPGMAFHLGWQGEYGWDGWLGAYFCNSPINGVSVIMTCQRRDAGTMPITRRIRDLLTASL